MSTSIALVDAGGAPPEPADARRFFVCLPDLRAWELEKAASEAIELSYTWALSGVLLAGQPLESDELRDLAKATEEGSTSNAITDSYDIAADEVTKSIETFNYMCATRRARTRCSA